MIGRCLASDRDAENAADFEAADHRQVEIEDDQIRRAAATAFSAASPLPTISASASPAALERVLDQPGDVLFVLDNEYVMFLHVSAVHTKSPEVSPPYRSC